MSFDVAADAYDRFMGRYSRLLAPQFADLAGVTAGQRAVDVGCGPGALTAELVARLGHAAVAGSRNSRAAHSRRRIVRRTAVLGRGNPAYGRDLFWADLPAGASGIDVCATDIAGNVASAASLVPGA